MAVPMFAYSQCFNLRQPLQFRKPAFQQTCRRVPSRAWRNKELKHVVDSREFSRECLDLVFTVAEQMEKVRPGSPDSKQLEGYCMATLFYEPSTRTRLSFEAAMGKLGGVILSTESAGEFSSAAKGETLEGNAPFLHNRLTHPYATSTHVCLKHVVGPLADTVRTVEGYADCLVLRHFSAGSAAAAAAVAQRPIISAGDGPGQHPTQVSESHERSCSTFLSCALCPCAAMCHSASTQFVLLRQAV